MVYCYTKFNFIDCGLIGFSGIGEASYAAIGPAIIGDIFVGNKRTKMLTIFYFTTIFGGFVRMVLSFESHLAVASLYYPSELEVPMSYFLTGVWGSCLLQECFS